jgi:hypothetical protein
MHAPKTRHRIALMAAAVLAIAASAPAAAPARASTSAGALSADLDGRAIALEQVGSLHCHDLDYPRIHCFTTEGDLQSAVAADASGPLAATASTAYVEIFENTSYGGGAMVVSQDYSMLATIGWNDRISSFIAVNAVSGTFHTDWLYGGSTWSFCCNQAASSIGAFNDTFSSVKRS